MKWELDEYPGYVYIMENAIYSDFLDDIARAVAYSLGDPGSFCTDRCLDFLIKAMFLLFYCPQ